MQIQITSDPVLDVLLHSIAFIIEQNLELSTLICPYQYSHSLYSVQSTQSSSED